MATSTDAPHRREGDVWQENKSLAECTRHMLESGLAADVTFKVSSNADGADVRTFRAHKFMLVCRSPVFESMLFGDLAEKGDITITDIEPDAFKQMLSYIYTDDLNLNLELVMFILYAAKKYLLLGLTTKCTDFLSKHLNASNACAFYDQSLLFQETDLEGRCLELIKCKTQAAFAAETATNISHNTLSKILDSERFSIWETEVFKFTLKWAEAKCKDQDQKAKRENNMREVLGECLYKIRFPSLEGREFAQIVSPSGILTRDEELGMFRHLVSKESISAPNQWLCRPRFKLCGPHQIYATEKTQSMEIYYTVIDLIIVSSREIKVHSLVFSTGYKHDYGMDFEVSLKSVKHNGTPVIGEVRNDGNEWKVSGDLIIKAQKCTLQMEYYTNGFEGRCIIMKNELLMIDEHVQIKVTSDSDHIPLLGLRYEFA